MKRKISVDVAKHKPKYVEREIEIWECPKCNKTFLEKETFWEVVKRTDDVLFDFDRSSFCGERIVCSSCGFVLKEVVLGGSEVGVARSNSSSVDSVESLS